ncbi:hypothetical protein PG996_008513 [Apiospora saccharicola]|uniref:C2H2-type domain-containing protein n=1 Tax=Apiospora saccharicola TaxID=335842 RepID=A0ABR1V0N4_9PEZI
MNPKHHSSCTAKTFQCIGSLCQHIRQVHRPKGCHDCESCFEPFTSEAELQAHRKSGTCRPTGGVRLPIVSRKHGTQSSKWYTVWSQLFPNFAPPRSPYRDENHEIDQFVQSFLRILQTSMPGILPQDQQNIAIRLRREASRWRSEPGEPLDHQLILAGPLAT